MSRIFLILLLTFAPLVAFADAEVPDETKKIKAPPTLKHIDIVAPIREMVLRNKTAIYSFIGLYAVWALYLDPFFAKWEQESRIQEALERRRKKRDFDRRVHDLELIEDTKQLFARLDEEERERELEREAEELGDKDKWYRDDDE